LPKSAELADWKGVVERFLAEECRSVSNEEFHVCSLFREPVESVLIHSEYKAARLGNRHRENDFAPALTLAKE
jgi:hypothetical protein